MAGRDWRDIVTGGAFVVLGLAAAWWAFGHFRIGSFRNIGPGMFPICVGLALAGFGLAIMIPAFFRGGAMPRPELVPALAVLASVAVFAAAARPLGLVPASVALVLVSLFAAGRPKPLQGLVLAAVLSALAWALFVRGLGVPLPAWRWPF